LLRAHKVHTASNASFVFSALCLFVVRWYSNPRLHGLVHAVKTRQNVQKTLCCYVVRSVTGFNPSIGCALCTQSFLDFAQCARSLKLQLLLALAESHKLALLRSNSAKHSEKARVFYGDDEDC
jgi:hypothetical protein